MTVKQLIAKLSKLPQDHKVYVRGYEGGIDDIKECEPVDVVRDVHTEWYYGKHETKDSTYSTDKDQPTEKGVQLTA